MKLRSGTEYRDTTAISPSGAPTGKLANLIYRRDVLRALLGATLVGKVAGCDGKFDEQEEFERREREEKQRQLTEEEQYNLDVTTGPEVKMEGDFYIVRYRTSLGAQKGGTEGLLRTIQDHMVREGVSEYDLIPLAPSAGAWGGILGYLVKPMMH